MNKTTQAVRSAVKVWVQRPDWYVVALGDCPTADDYIRAFAKAMDALVAHSQISETTQDMGLAVAFGTTEGQAVHSYRSVLKKYSRSPVFEDLRIHLLLVRADDSVLHLPPEQINTFLIDLNRYIKRA